MNDSDMRWIFAQPDPEMVRQAMTAFDVPEIYGKVLVQRDILSRESGKEFFNPRWERLHDPFLMKDMDRAVTRIIEQIQADKPILIFGDYDVDGTTAAAMLYLVLKSLKARVTTYIPSRETEGYGLSGRGIDFAKTMGADLLITCDCGITDHSEVQYANEVGVTVIITDHHRPGEKIPAACAVLNPKQIDCPYPFKGLCGGGVAFKLALALVTRLNLNPELVWSHADLIALGTAADIVPLLDENRVIVSMGLALIRDHTRPGIASLIQAGGLAGKEINVSRLVFGVAPKINAAGRLGDASRAVRLLITGNSYEAATMAKALVAENRRRQRIQEQTVEDALFQVNSAHDLTAEFSLILHSENWHQGVIGIVAARVRDAFYRPTGILTIVDGVAKGSLRSLAGFDLFEALTACREYLDNFGGHAMAAGLTMKPENIAGFATAFNDYAKSILSKDDLIPRQYIEGQLDLQTIDQRFIKFLRSLEPHGPGNRRPVFACRGVRSVGIPRLVGESRSHLKFSVAQNGTSFSAIGFDMARHYEKMVLEKPLDIAFVVEENVWQGRREIQLLIKDIKTGEQE